MVNLGKTSAEIIYLNRLRDKLLDLKSSSSKIRLYLRKDLTWDLWELEELATKINIGSFITSSISSPWGKNNEEIFLDFSPLFQSLEEVEEKEAIRKKVKKLRRNVQRIYLEKGVNSLFLGVFSCGDIFPKSMLSMPPCFSFRLSYKRIIWEST